MNRSKRVGMVCGVAGLALVAVVVWRRGAAFRQAEAEVSRQFSRNAAEWGEGEELLGRAEAGRSSSAPGPVALPDGWTAPGDEAALAELVAWMRGLGHDELLRFSNAEFDFEKSELIERLQALEGAWVVPALGGLAVVESDPLLKAILVEGLLGGYSSERVGHPELIPILDSLLQQMALAADDPYEVAHNMAMVGWEACVISGQNYAQLIAPRLATSDNRGLLSHGYLCMGMRPGGSEELLKQMLTGHGDRNGRFGALEGLRQSAADGRVPPAEITALGLGALATETDERNRLLLYEMMISKGGEEALTAVEQALRSGRVAEIDKTVEMLAMKMEPARAQALFEDLMRERELGGEARQALYRAMGLAQGEAGADFLLGVARNDELDESERLAGLRGLWNREVDERLAGELRDVFDSAEDPALRTEALRMLAHGESTGAGLDLRAVAALDDDAGVRAEAVQLAAMQPGMDTREWLEERLQADRSFDVKAAALGALVYQAHYTGDGDAVLGYLERARKFTGDEQALAMIAEGERMVREHDPRSLELGLAEEAEFWGKVAGYTDGPAARSFERQAKQLSQIVCALRTTRDGRPAR